VPFIAGGGTLDLKCRVTTARESAQMLRNVPVAAGGLGCILPKTPSRGARDERGCSAQVAPRIERKHRFDTAAAASAQHPTTTTQHAVCPNFHTRHFVLCMIHNAAVASLRSPATNSICKHFNIIYKASTVAQTCKRVPAILRAARVLSSHVTTRSQLHVRQARCVQKAGGPPGCNPASARGCRLVETLRADRQRVPSPRHRT
jgi:hypothetical protein